MALTDIDIAGLANECFFRVEHGVQLDRIKFARAIEAIVAAPLLARIAELERALDDLGVTPAEAHAGAKRSMEKDARIAALTAQVEQAAQPIDMVLHCPACGMQHVDAPDEVPGQPILKSAPTTEHPHKMVQVGTYTAQGEWTNPPHKSHLCRPEDGGCGHIWRPADVPTNGVAAIKTKGKADSPADEVKRPAELACGPDYKHMFLEAVQALANIDRLLGLPEDGCNDPQVTVSALADFLAGAREAAQFRDHWVDAQYQSEPQPVQPSDADITSAREHLADVHNAEQLRSALSQLRRDVVIELAARGLVPAIYGVQAKPEQAAQPVAWINYRIKCDNSGNFARYGDAELSFDRGSYGYDWNRSQPLYLAPPKAVPLTQPEKQRLWNDATYNNRSSTTDAAMEYGSAIENHHGITPATVEKEGE